MPAKIDYTPVLQALIAAAETGAAMPDNTVLGGLVSGSRCVSRSAVASGALQALRGARLIEMTRPGRNLRQVRIVASGKMTAPTPIHPTKTACVAALLPEAGPSRDSCFHCGTRADLHRAHGCRSYAGEARFSFQQEEHAP